MLNLVSHRLFGVKGTHNLFVRHRYTTSVTKGSPFRELRCRDNCVGVHTIWYVGIYLSFVAVTVVKIKRMGREDHPDVTFGLIHASSLFHV